MVKHYGLDTIVSLAAEFSGSTALIRFPAQLLTRKQVFYFIIMYSTYLVKSITVHIADAIKSLISLVSRCTVIAFYEQTFYSPVSTRSSVPCAVQIKSAANSPLAPAGCAACLASGSELIPSWVLGRWWALSIHPPPPTNQYSLFITVIKIDMYVMWSHEPELNTRQPNYLLPYLTRTQLDSKIM